MCLKGTRITFTGLILKPIRKKPCSHYDAKMMPVHLPVLDKTEGQLKRPGINELKPKISIGMMEMIALFGKLVL